MKHRKLRIAWSVGWGIAAVLLIALWVHSYWYQVSVQRWIFDRAVTDSHYWQGWIEARYFSITPFVDASQIPDSFVKGKYVERALPDIYPKPGWMYHNYSEPAQTYLYVQVPFWFTVILTAAIGTLSWFLPRQFSLRTVLIATTLVAVGLGLIVWLR
ncbi:MAG TPA: hypothetical protein VHU84_09680 [Lacipirellulaceae bacterium]|jgi:hypothetical protein|nr:hypothetical protein [Lacipirellulaceae bacterium]